MSDSLPPTRQLAAIVFVDIVGYSRMPEQQGLMAGTVVRQIVERLAGHHQGQLLKSMGDGFLLVFPSALSATECALAIQSALPEDAAGLSSSEPLRLRIGIHLGDVEHRGNDVLGAGVNIAARVQALARPGEVWFTQPVWDQVRERLDRAIVQVGQRRLRNIAQPVTLYRITVPGASAGLARLQSLVQSYWRWGLAALIVGAVSFAVIQGPKWLEGQRATTPASTGTTNLEASAAFHDGEAKLQRYDQQNAVAGAIVDLERAVSLDPDFAEAHAELAKAYARKFDLRQQPLLLDRARASAWRAVQLHTNLASARLARGMVLRRSGAVDEAVVELEFAHRQDAASPGSFFEAAFELAEARWQQAKPAESLRILQEAKQKRPGYWACDNELGKFYLRQPRPDYGQAEQHFRLAASNSTPNYQVLANIGGLHYLQGKSAEARRELLQSNQIETNDQACANLGTVLFFDGDYPGAVEMFRFVVANNPDLAQGWLNLADAARLAGERATAQDAYARASRGFQGQLARAPRDGQLLALQAFCESHLGHAQEALDGVASALAEAPKNDTVAFFAALVYEAIGQREKAVQAVGRATEFGYPAHEILSHPDLKSLRLDPRFTAIAEKLKRN